MECEGSARMEEGKRNQAGYIPEYDKFTVKMGVKKQQPRQHLSKQNKYVYTTIQYLYCSETQHNLQLLSILIQNLLLISSCRQHQA